MAAATSKVSSWKGCTPKSRDCSASASRTGIPRRLAHARPLSARDRATGSAGLCVIPFTLERVGPTERSIVLVERGVISVVLLEDGAVDGSFSQRQGHRIDGV